MDEKQVIQIVDLRIAQIMESTMDALRRIHIEENAAADEVYLTPKQAASVTVQPRKISPYTKPPKPNWRTADLHGRKDPDLTNVYQILKDEYGLKQFDARTAHKQAFKACSLQRLLLELKRLEIEGLARPLDELRLMWMLERV